jgi:hypothetical protein
MGASDLAKEEDCFPKLTRVLPPNRLERQRQGAPNVPRRLDGSLRSNYHLRRW